MESLGSFNLLSVQFLLSLVIVLSIFCIFYYFALQRQKQLGTQLDLALRRQETTNQQLALILKEIRRSNQYLEVVSGPTDPESEAEPTTLEATTKLYVGNIDYSVTEEELGALFASYGQITLVNIPVNRYTGKARGFGFVTFFSSKEAEQALILQGTELKGRQLQVNYAKERGTVE